MRRRGGARLIFFQERRRVVLCGAGRLAAARRTRGGPRPVRCARGGEEQVQGRTPDRIPASAIRSSRRVARGRCYSSDTPANTAQGDTATRYALRLSSSALLVSLQAASKTRARTRSVLAFHALEDVAPRLLVDFGPFLRPSQKAVEPPAIDCWSQRLKRGGWTRTHVLLPAAQRFGRERFEDADAAAQ